MARAILSHLVVWTSLMGGLSSLAAVPPSIETPIAPAGDVASAPDIERRAEAYFHLIRARLAAGRGQGAEVAAEIRDAVAADPGSADLHAESARILQMIGRRAESERLARRALELDPEQGVALRVLADLLNARSLGQPSATTLRQEAIRLYEKLASRDDAEDEVLVHLVQLSLRDGNRGGAIEAARRLAGRRPDDVQVVRLLVHTLLSDDRVQEVMDLLAAYRGSPAEAEDLLPIALELARRTDEWSAVVNLGLRAVEAPEVLPTTRRALAEALLRQGRTREAIGSLEAAVAAAPQDRGLRATLAVAYGRTGRLADATRLARALAEEPPGEAEYQALLAEALARQGDTEGAVDAFRKALRAFDAEGTDDSTRNDAVRRSLGVVLIGAGRAAEARRVLEPLTETGDAGNLELKARASLGAGDLKDARRLAKKLRTAGELGTAGLIEFEVLLRQGDLTPARAAIPGLIPLLPEGGRARVAELLSDVGQPEEALAQLREWVRLAPDDPRARFALGSFLDRSGRFPEAEEELRESIERNPNDPVVLNYLAYSLAVRGEKLEEALGLVQRALDLDPDNGAYLDSLGWIYFRMGRFEEALQPLVRAGREFPYDPTVLEHLGDLHEKRGDMAQARAYWERALRAKPEDPGRLRGKLKN